MQPEAAQILALHALAWVAADDVLLPRFMEASGSSSSDLRARAADADFLAAVLDFLLQEDSWVIAFCDANALPYTAPQAARTALPGGEAMHWT